MKQNIGLTAADPLDEIDRRLLRQLQQDASLTNQALAERCHVSAATCLRRVRRLERSGVLQRRVALVNPDGLGGALQAICEVVLDRQGVEHADAFEAVAAGHPAVQQLYRVSAGPDFVLILAVRSMQQWEAVSRAMFTQQGNVRNVRTFFVTRRGKFDPAYQMLV